MTPSHLAVAAGGGSLCGVLADCCCTHRDVRFAADASAVSCAGAEELACSPSTRAARSCWFSEARARARACASSACACSEAASRPSCTVAALRSAQGLTGVQRQTHLELLQERLLLLLHGLAEALYLVPVCHCAGCEGVS